MGPCALVREKRTISARFITCYINNRLCGAKLILFFITKILEYLDYAPWMGLIHVDRKSKREREGEGEREGEMKNTNNRFEKLKKSVRGICNGIKAAISANFRFETVMQIGLLSGRRYHAGYYYG